MINEEISNRVVNIEVNVLKATYQETFITEIYFDKKSKDTFQDKLFKVVKAERK